MRPLKRAALFFLIVLWLSAVAGGTLLFQQYESTPGRANQPPAQWPSATRLTPTAGHSNLVIALHPRCPCSRASVAELGRIAADHPGAVTVHVLFMKPSDSPDGWEQGALWDAAASIPGARLIADSDGVEARRFGALTSGQVLVYDRQGALQFSGGITRARGVAGDNEGQRAVAKNISGLPDASQACVYGCPLFDANK